MHTVERFENGVELANQLGYIVRHEYLGGSGGGICEFAGKRWIFIDLALTSIEQLEQLQESLNEIEASFGRTRRSAA